MPHAVNEIVAKYLANAYVEFLQKQRSLFFNKEISLTLSDEVLEKPDSYTFVATAEERPTYICIGKN